MDNGDIGILDLVGFLVLGSFVVSRLDDIYHLLITPWRRYYPVPLWGSVLAREEPPLEDNLPDRRILGHALPRIRLLEVREYRRM